MYRLMIIEDEPLERKAMRMLVQRHLPLLEVTGEAENGFDALDKIESLRPDIVFVDINMPGMDGLATIRAIRERGLPCRFVILTSYSSFDYARQAIRLGVEDFLVKPADLDTVKKTVQTVIAHIEDERNRVRDTEELKDRVLEMSPVLEKDLVRRIMEKGKDPSELMKLLNLTYHRAAVLLAECPEDSRVFEERVRKYLSSGDCRILSDCQGRRLTILIFSIESGFDFKSVLEKLNREINHSASILIACGTVCDSSAELHSSYLTAAKLIESARASSRALSFPEDLEGNDPGDFPIKRYAELFHSLLLRNEREELSHTVELFFSDLAAPEGSRRLSCRTYVYQAAIMISQKISESSGIYSFWDEIQKEKTLILRETELSALKLYFINYLDKISAILSSDRISRQDVIIRETLLYLKMNFRKAVSLEDLADHLKLSSSYLSKVIRKNTNRGFPDILNNYRIDEAMALLQENRLSIKEITYRVGYNSQHYFSRIFKKQTGFSPSDFRNRRESS